MKAPSSRTTSADAIVGLWTIALASFVMALLYFARDLLIPLALAALLTFLLSPLVSRLGDPEIHAAACHFPVEVGEDISLSTPQISESERVIEEGLVGNA